MAVTMRVVLLTALVSTLCLESVFACMCMPAHPQTDFCNSEFVFRGKILSKNPVYGGMNPDMPMKIVYKVQVNTVYRNSGSGLSIKEEDEMNITTSGFQSTCGVVNMLVNTRYLITAKETDGKLVANLCSWNVPFSDVTNSQKKMLRRSFEQECASRPQCEIKQYCGAPNPSQCQQFDGCTFYQREDCYYMHSYCTRKNGQCQWRNTSKGTNTCN